MTAKDSSHASPLNPTSLTGVRIGHVSLRDTGVTALFCGAQGAVASVDVRGGGPGTRETDLLEPHNTVERVHAVILSGGSAFGLAAADGAMRELATGGIGFPVFGEDKPGPRVPIVPAAVIFDLATGEVTYPQQEHGAQAIAAAMNSHDSTQGSVGAGVGATAGHLRGGFGWHTVNVPVAGGNYEVSACIVLNPVGEVVNFSTGELFADSARRVDPQKLAAVPHPLAAKLNTTIGAVITDAPLSKAQVKRLALSAHDGIARAVRPAHSPLDGDTIFGLSTALAGTASAGVDIPTMTAVCAAAADAVQGAIANAVITAGNCAQDGLGLTTFGDIEQLSLGAEDASK